MEGGLIELLRRETAKMNAGVPAGMTRLDDGRIIPLPPLGRLKFYKCCGCGRASATENPDSHGEPCRSQMRGKR